MSLSQVQIIQSLGEALAWFEKELGWGVSPGELGHLTGRIGELYAAMITRGQMALATNQRGYDVISAENERISVKTVTTSNHVGFNLNTFDQVDRIIVLRINVDEGEAAIEELLDCPTSEARRILRESGGKLIYPTTANRREAQSLDNLSVTAQASDSDFVIKQYENSTITVEKSGDRLEPAKPILRELADKHRVSLLNSNGNPKNSRQLGADVIRAIEDSKIGN